MITEFGEFGFEVGEEQKLFPVYNFTKEPSNGYSFNIKMNNKWVTIYYWNSTENPKWLWTTKYDKRAHEWHYDLFPYRVTKFYYNTALETM